MENNKFLICVILIIGAFVRVNSLQCYQCTDCPDGTLKDEWLMDCPPKETTVTPPTIPENSTEIPIPPGNSTEVPIPPSNSTEVPIPPSNSTEAPIPPGNDTEVQPPSENGTSGYYTDNSIPELKNPNAIRVRRNILPEIVTLDSGCQCAGESCTCDDPDDMQNLLYADNSTIEYVCAKGTVKNATGYEMVIRGCAPSKIIEKDFCTYVTSEANATDCKTCATDKCNNAIALQQPIAALMAVLMMALLTK